MKRSFIILAMLMVLALCPTVIAIGFLNHIPSTDAIEKNYRELADKEVSPNMGFLDVSASVSTDDLTIFVTIDNATTIEVHQAVIFGAMAYINYYLQHNEPGKAIIYVYKAGETQIGTGTIYSKWVDDWRENPNHSGHIGYSDTADRTLLMKVWNATNVWTWELPKVPEP